MNPFAQNQYDRIEGEIKKLSANFDEYESRLERAEKEKELKVQECWIATRKANALRETLKSMPQLKMENKQLRKKNAEALVHARSMLVYAKTISGAIDL